MKIMKCQHLMSQSDFKFRLGYLIRVSEFIAKEYKEKPHNLAVIDKKLTPELYIKVLQDYFNKLAQMED